MPEPEEIANQRDQLTDHRRRLSICLKQLGMLGPAHASPALFLDIRDARASIQCIKQTLRAMGELVDDHPDDEPRRSEKLEGLPAPSQVPPAPSRFVERIGSAEKLRNALLDDDDATPLTLLYGMSGTGKSSLAAYVVRQLDDSIFPDGVLWGSLDNLTPSELLVSFLGALNSAWYHSAPRENNPLRKIFWQILADANARALIVLDNVKDARQLAELLPLNIARISRCRILAISLYQLDNLPAPAHEQPLSYFTEQEALNLFHQYIPDEQFKHHEDKLREISQRLEYLPQLLVAAAHDFATRKVSPNSYLQMLRQGEGQKKLFGGALRDSFEVTIRDLAPEQLVLLELIGVLGDADWPDAMLAAIALRRLSDIRRDLTILVDYAFITRVGTDRYRANTLIRELARQRFQKRPVYLRDAAYTLLARYCLDAAQDLEAALLADPNLRTLSGHPIKKTDKEFVQAFREGLMPEMSHIRQVLEWATNCETWDLLLRFSYVSSMELVKGFVANGFAISMALRMATLVEPLVWLQGDRQRLACRSLIISNSWTYNAPSDGLKTIEQRVAADDLKVTRDRKPSEEDRSELSLNIVAGNIIDGIFDTMILADARWTGVRASGLLCRNVDIVGGRFLACDLSQAVFLRCDARRATLLGSNMSQALLRRVQLQGAQLQELNLAGAVLEHVDLRGADLRAANLAGAVLEHVDLRGADLRDADCSLVQIEQLTLIGCRTEQTRWAGARFISGTQTLIVEDPTFMKEIELAIQELPDRNAKPARQRWRPIEAILQKEQTDFSYSDLRGVEFEAQSLVQLNLHGADLRAAVLRKAVLSGSNLHTANLRAADLSATDLSNTSLYGADMYVAILNDASLEKADLSSAILRSARLERAALLGAYLEATNLRATYLVRANLRSAVLTNADLTDANLHAATLASAKLTNADLTNADLTNADLTNADLTNADFWTFDK